MPAFDGETVASITPAKVRAWIAGLREKGVAPATIPRIYQTFKRMMDIAVTDGYRPRTPCVGIMLPSNEAAREEPVFLNAKQVLALADAVAPRFRALVLVGPFGGLRIGEMAAPLAEDLRLDGDDPHIIIWPPGRIRATVNAADHQDRRAPGQDPGLSRATGVGPAKARPLRAGGSQRTPMGPKRDQRRPVTTHILAENPV